MSMELWSLEDVMRELQVGRPTAYRILKTYGRKLGRRFVVPADVVKAALWGGAVEAEKDPSRKLAFTKGEKDA